MIHQSSVGTTLKTTHGHLPTGRAGSQWPGLPHHDLRDPCPQKPVSRRGPGFCQACMAFVFKDGLAISPELNRSLTGQDCSRPCTSRSSIQELRFLFPWLKLTGGCTWGRHSLSPPGGPITPSPILQVVRSRLRRTPPSPDHRERHWGVMMPSPKQFLENRYHGSQRCGLLGPKVAAAHQWRSSMLRVEPTVHRGDEIVEAKVGELVGPRAAIWDKHLPGSQVGTRQG